MDVVPIPDYRNREYQHGNYDQAESFFLPWISEFRPLGAAIAIM